MKFVSFFFLKYPFIIYLFIYYFWLCWVLGPCEGFLQLRQAGATLHHGARAPHHRGPSRCGAQAPDAQAQQLWLTGPAAPRHVGSSQTRARTRVPRISRQTPNHCATREALKFVSDSTQTLKIFCFLYFQATGVCSSYLLFGICLLKPRHFSLSTVPLPGLHEDLEGSSPSASSSRTPNSIAKSSSWPRIRPELGSE